MFYIYLNNLTYRTIIVATIKYSTKIQFNIVIYCISKYSSYLLFKKRRIKKRNRIKKGKKNKKKTEFSKSSTQIFIFIQEQQKNKFKFFDISSRSSLICRVDKKRSKTTTGAVVMLSVYWSLVNVVRFACLYQRPRRPR